MTAPSPSPAELEREDFKHPLNVLKRLRDDHRSQIIVDALDWAIDALDAPAPVGVSGLEEAARTVGDALEDAVAKLIEQRRPDLVESQSYFAALEALRLALVQSPPPVPAPKGEASQAPVTVYHVSAYDESGYGEDCSKYFTKTEREAAIGYAKSLDARFGAVVNKHVQPFPPLRIYPLPERTAEIILTENRAERERDLAFERAPKGGADEASVERMASDAPGLLKAADLMDAWADSVEIGSRGGLGTMFANQSANDVRNLAKRFREQVARAALAGKAGL